VTPALASWVSLAGALIAAVYDVRTGKIPNALTYGLSIAGGILLIWTPALERTAVLVGVLAVAALVLALYSQGLMGGGDAKLLVGLAFLQSYPMIVYTIFYSFLIGGVVAAVVLAYRGRLFGFFGEMIRLKEIKPGSEGPPLPFAAFVLAGTIASVVSTRA
jgi:Flp pilus assembly protein protease CpaA